MWRPRRKPGHLPPSVSLGVILIAILAYAAFAIEHRQHLLH